MAQAQRSQIVLLPDGKQMVCWYFNDGRVVNCEYLWNQYTYFTGLSAYGYTLRLLYGS